MSKKFDVICGMVIVCNALTISYATDQAIANPNHSNATFVDTCELVFTIFYTCELCAKFACMKCDFFAGRDGRWNMFDSFLVLTAIYQQVVLLFELQSLNQNLTVLRLMRLMKMIKVFRIVRLMRFVRELRLIVASILGSVLSMLWSMVLIGLVTLIFGITLVQFVTGYLADNKVWDNYKEFPMLELQTA